MGLLTWWAKNGATATVGAGLSNASDAKLAKHCNALQRAHRVTGDPSEQAELALLLNTIRDELLRRRVAADKNC